MTSTYTYQSILGSAEKIHWRVEDIIGPDKRLDFQKPFLPEEFARVEPLEFLTRQEKLALNQIRGYGYLCTFGLVEEFILPFVMDHTRSQLDGDDYRVRALLRFAGEEAKHIHLFKRFAEEFLTDFKTPCDVIGPPQEIARIVLSHHPLAVALLILHIEWMTQRHYVGTVQDHKALDGQFKSLLRHHWMEEAQHAKLDTLMIEALAEGCTEAEIDRAFSEYLQIGTFLDGGLKQQVEFDLQSFTRATRRELNASEQDQFRRVQTQALRWTYLGSGMTHENFLGTLGGLKPAARAQLENLAPAFS
jgi:hypothetical protein